jgi:hypothetical protein
MFNFFCCRISQALNRFRPHHAVVSSKFFLQAAFANCTSAAFQITLGYMPREAQNQEHGFIE